MRMVEAHMVAGCAKADALPLCAGDSSSKDSSPVDALMVPAKTISARHHEKVEETVTWVPGGQSHTMYFSSYPQVGYAHTVSLTLETGIP